MEGAGLGRASPEGIKLNIKSTRERLLASTMIVGSLSLIATAQASAQAVQTAQPGATAPATAPGGGGADVVPATSANGQPTAASGQETAVQEVVVTGSRIPQPGLTSTSPLTVVNDQEIKLEGTTNVEDLINNLPQAVAEQTSQVSNGSTGTATADLRGLGSNRTLVLIDGKRLMPGDPSLPSPDLNNIPAQLVDRVEVTTGGASAIYGSDAVAGVVNFVMKRDFQGVRLDAQGGFFQSDNSGNNSIRSAIGSFNQGSANPISIPGSVADGRKIDVTGIIGLNAPDGKGNVTGYVEYRNLQPVTQNNRVGSACGLSTVGHANAAGQYDMIYGGYNYDTHVCQGSSNSAYGHFNLSSITTQAGAAVASGAGLAAAGATTAGLSANPDGTKTFAPYTGALAYNFGPLNYFQREDDRYTAGYFAHYAVNTMFDLYSDFMFNDDRTVAQIAPSGAFRGTGSNGTSTLAVNCDNPLLSTSQATQLCGQYAGTTDLANLTAGYRFTAGGPRQDDLRHTEYKIDVGSRGDLGQGWNYDAYYQYGTSIFSEEYMNDVSVSRLQNALEVSPVTGQCESNAPGCVPANLFQFGQLSKAAIAYTSVPGFQEGQNIEQIVSASLTGDLGQYGLKSPLATDGIGVALGGEYRRENLVLTTDEEFSSGDLSGQGGPKLGNSGTFDVYELFGEVRVPLVQDKPFVKSFAFDGAYRYSDYSTAGITDTYEATLNYAVDRNIAFRGGYNRAVRAPNVNELFAAQSVALFSGSDPCAGANPTTSLAACARTGVTAAQFGFIQPCPASQCSELAGGNPNLAPEKSDTYTAGIVFTPTFLRGFSLTVDYFNIQVKGLIQAGVGGANVTLSQCLSTGSPVYCNLIHRDPATGDLFGNTGYVIATNVNTGFLRTEGIDVESNYRFRLSDLHLPMDVPNIGTFTLNLVGTYTYEFVDQPVSGGGTFNCAGFYGSDKCGSPLPRYRQKTRLTWAPPYPFTLSLQWRYIGGTKLDVDSANPFLSGITNAPIGAPVYDTADERLPTINYMDVSATYKIKDGLTARVGVNNVLDTNAPIVDSNVFPASGPPYGNGNTFPGLYDALGREFFFGITADF